MSYEAGYGAADTCGMCFERFTTYAKGFRYLMKTIESSPYPLITLKSFRRVTLIVCLCWSTRYKVSCVSGVFGMKLD